MSNIEQLHKGVMTELLEFLNICFTGRADSRHFEDRYGKFFVDDEEHMACHYAIREEGKLVASVGIYPYTVYIGDKKFTFATVGNMGVDPSTRGKGYMNELYLNANKVLNEKGIDVARLGGLRSRYDRYGYEPCGFMYNFTFLKRNGQEYLRNNDVPKYEIKTFTETEKEIMDFVRNIYSKQGIHIDRGDDHNFYQSLIFFASTPYVALVDGKPVGYFSTSGGQIYDLTANTPENVVGILSTFVAKEEKDFNLMVAPDMVENIRLLSKVSEDMNLTISSRYKIMNWAGIVEASLALKSTVAPLTDGELILGIEDYGNFKISVKNGEPSCEKTEENADLALRTHEASRLLFGPLEPMATAEIPKEKAAFAAANFPLYLYTPPFDKV